MSTAEAGGAARQTLASAGARALALVLGLANLVVVARALAPAGQGEYALFLAVSSIAATVADAGVSQALVTYAATQPHARTALREMVLRLCAAITVPLVVAAGALAMWADETVFSVPRETVVAALLYTPVALYVGWGNQQLIGAGNVLRFNAGVLLFGAIVLVLDTVFVALLEGQLRAAVVCHVAAALIQAAAVHVWLRQIGGAAAASEATQQPGLLRNFALFALRAYPNGVANVFWSRLPVLLLNATHGPVAVGVFSVAQQIAEKLMLPVVAAQDVSYHRIALLPLASATEVTNRSARLILWATVAVACVTALAAAVLVPFVVGPEYEAAAEALALLCIGLPAIAVAMMLGPFFLCQLRRPGLLSALAWGNVALVLGLGVVLIPRYAASGAAAAIALAQVIGTLVAAGFYVTAVGTPVQALVVPRVADGTQLFRQWLQLARLKKATETRL